MAGLRSLLGKGKDNGEQAREAVKELEKSFPNVAEVLGGVAATKTLPEISPGTITISVRDGRIKFSANVKSETLTFYGELSDVLKPWESIEYALSAGEVSSKRYTVQAPSLTEEQKSLIL